MSLFPNNTGIKAKLITIFVVIKVLPLIALAWLAWQGIQSLGEKLSDDVSKMASEMRDTAKNVGNLALQESVTALDNQAQEAIEKETTATASAIANFLYSIDKDITSIASFSPDESTYKNFIETRRRNIPIHGPWKLNQVGSAWVAEEKEVLSESTVHALIENNQRKFHYRQPHTIHQRKSRPIYLEITFIDLDGNEKIKITTSEQLEKNLRDISDRHNTWIKAETYFDHISTLSDNDIYVSSVIGAYVASPIIGLYTPKNTSAKGIPYEPEKAAYAGKENPVGQRFKGLIRWVKPVIQEGKRLGYVTLALDHSHLMAFTDHLVPTAERFSEISDAGSGNYAFMWDHLGRNISHPRDYFIVGYDPKTGKQVPSWLDQSTHKEWKNSRLPFDKFIKNTPKFRDQGLKLKPTIEQIKAGQVALDCRYLNFAPQCTDWLNLTQHGGSGSFMIFWSGIWKLTTAATIPYFTGQYGKSPRGFGFVTIGANVDEFHLPATTAKGQIDQVILDEDKTLIQQQEGLQQVVIANLKQLIVDLSISTFVMIIIVIGVGFWMASYLTRRILHLIYGLNQFRMGDFKYRFAIESKDEMGKLAYSFNTVARAIDTAVSDLSEQVTKRKKIEDQLEEINTNLEETVESRTLELENTNRLLTLENEERKKAEQRLSLMAQYDDLTGLANRILFRDHLVMAMAQARRTQTKVGLLYIDLDKFKEVNDSLGHDIGDTLLTDVADILSESIREGDTAARLGGDEFALIVTQVLDTDHLADMAQRVLDQLTTPITIEDKPILIGASIGIALFPDDANEIELLTKHADIAMYQAKEHGGSNYQFFIAEMQKTAEQHKSIEKELREAIATDCLILHYQPKIDIASNTILGAEALVRWNHPKRGLIGPYDFIPIAEKSGLIHPLGEYVLREACRQNKQWQEDGYDPIQIAVNVSAIQLKNPDIVERVAEALQEANLSPKWLEVELTETTIMHNPKETLRVISKLQQLGVCLSIDDFGTGYSSFGRLKELVFDVLKIDRSFVKGIGNKTDNAIVKAMIGMAHALGIKLLAEGVETNEQLTFLKQEGCDQFQGYLYSKPVPADEFPQLLREPTKQPQQRYPSAG